MERMKKTLFGLFRDHQLHKKHRWRTRPGWKLALTLGVCLFAVLVSVYAQAAVSKYITYQGKLTDAEGNPLTRTAGTIGITVKIYDSATGETALFSENHMPAVSNGIFNIVIGNLTTGGIDLPFDEDYWIELVVGGQTLSPRHRLTCAGYAIRTDVADSLKATADITTSSLTLSGNLTVNGNTTLGDALADTLAFNASTLSIPNNLNIDSSTLYIDATNKNVGIGTTSPQAKLHILPSEAAALQINPYGTGTGNTGEVRLLELSANGTNYVVFKAPDAITSNVIWTLPNADGSSGYALTTDGSGNLSWAQAGVNDATYITQTSHDSLTNEQALSLLSTGVMKVTTTTGVISSMTGTANYVTRWTDTSTLGTGVLYDDGTYVGIGTDSPDQLLHLGASATPLVFEGETDNTYETTFSITGPTADRTIIVPDAPGTVAVSATSPITLSSAGDIGIGADTINGTHLANNIELVDADLTVESNALFVGYSGGGYAGKVGIGTTSPGYKLEVAGTLGVKSNGSNTGELKVGYTPTSPAGYYATYAPDPE